MGAHPGYKKGGDREPFKILKEKITRVLKRLKCRGTTVIKKFPMNHQ